MSEEELIEKQNAMPMKCPKCEREMEEGYVRLATSENAWVLWTAEEEPPDFWKRIRRKELRDQWKRDTFLRNTVFLSKKEDSLRKGFRCSSCRIVLLEY